MIELNGVWKTYQVGDQPLHALKDVSLEVEDGGYLAVMGPSGSGKSTLLSILGCLDRPTQGSYRLDGDEVGSLDEPQLSEIRRWKIGFVFQSFHLVPRLEAAENVALPMVLAGIPAAERRERVAKALDAVGLAKRASHRPAELSGGECQRVAIARSMVMQPRLLLADEPTGNLDSKSGASVMELIEGMNANGLTLIVVTHDANIGRRANNVVVLRDGEIDQLVPGSELHYGLELANPREPAG
ncbi:MAG: ABC transporter ATP-binding protein [Deltaproteobacteria bacterium]|nr:ABC transporter ATP-binding protein [Deltaproteobacteria bacterium]